MRCHESGTALLPISSKPAFGIGIVVQVVPSSTASSKASYSPVTAPFVSNPPTMLIASPATGPWIWYSRHSALRTGRSCMLSKKPVALFGRSTRSHSPAAPASGLVTRTRARSRMVFPWCGAACITCANAVNVVGFTGAAAAARFVRPAVYGPAARLMPPGPV